MPKCYPDLVQDPCEISPGNWIIWCSTSQPWLLSPISVQLLRLVPRSAGEESAWNAGDTGLIPGSERSPGEGIGYPLQYAWASLVVQTSKESACNAGDLGSILGLERLPGGGHSNPLQYSCLNNPHGQRSLAATVHGVTESRACLRDSTARIPWRSSG